MEGRAIKAKYAGTQGLLYDHRNDRDKIRLNGGKPKDHGSENVRKMRQQAKDRKALEEEKAALLNKKETFKLSQFKDVHGRAQNEAAKLAKNAETKHEYTKAGSGRTCAGVAPRSDQTNYVPRQKEKPRVPRVEDMVAAEEEEKPSTNFLKLNFTKVVKNETPSRQHAPVTARPLPTRSSARGEVPKYLINRKQMLAEKAQLERDNYDPKCPDGMVAMPEEERISALQILNQNKNELTAQLTKISFARSLATDKRQNQIYSKLNEIDDAIDVFSKPKVYVTV